MKTQIAKIRRWIKKFWRLILAMAATSALVAGVEATPWPPAAKTGLIMAISMVGGSGVFFSLIDHSDERRAVAEANRQIEATNRENAELRRQTEATRQEKEATERENAELRRQTEASAQEKEATERENAELRRRIAELEQRNNGHSNP